MADFFIVVPTFNSGQVLDRCLASIVATQPGNFGRRVHIQDGCSTDDTLRIAEQWRNKGVTYSSERDNGTYDAVNRASTRAESHEVMTWLGSDDLFMPGALATAASIFDQLADIDWITGQPLVSNEYGETFTPFPQMDYIRREVAAGLFDGRTRGFIMQEGTFWRVSLWQKVRGIDSKYQLAGDWDLWRRFAQHTPLYALTFPLGRFTRRPGQKSENMTDYYKEIDESAALPEVLDDFSRLLKRAPWAQRWEIEELNHATSQPPPASESSLVSEPSLVSESSRASEPSPTPPRPTNFIARWLGDRRRK
jgi:glycosyltransferase involved in cell wall biosynthesis